MQGKTSWTIAADHPVFAGHFPGRPIVPGVLLLDAALQAIRQSGQMPGGPCRITSAKFLSPVLPGETLVIAWQLTDTGLARFEISGDARQVASGVFGIEVAP